MSSRYSRCMVWECFPTYSIFFYLLKHFQIIVNYCHFSLLPPQELTEGRLWTARLGGPIVVLQPPLTTSNILFSVSDCSTGKVWCFFSSLRKNVVASVLFTWLDVALHLSVEFWHADGVGQVHWWQDQFANPWPLGILGACIALKSEQVGFPVAVYSKISTPKKKIRSMRVCACLASVMLNDMER